MADQVQRRGGTAAENDAFTGMPREVTVDTTNNTLRVHDGATQGGFPLLSENQGFSVYNVLGYGAVGDGVADDTTAIQNAINAASPGGVVYFPEGNYLVTGNLDATFVTLKGSGVTAGDGGGYATTGSVITTKNTANPMFKIGHSVTFDGLVFFYPDQDGSTVSPTVYEPCIQTKDENVVSLRVNDCSFVNPYRAIVQAGTGSIGRWHITDTQFYGIKSCLEIIKAPDIVHLSNVMMTTATYGAVANQGANNLSNWTKANGEAVILDGQVDGFNWNQGIIHAYNRGISIKDTAATGKPTQLGTVSNVLFECNKGTEVQNPASITHFEMVACTIASLTSDSENNFGWRFNSSTTSRSMVITGCNFTSSNGRHVVAGAGGLAKLTISGCQFSNWARATTLTRDTAAIDIADGQIDLQVDGCTFDQAAISNGQDPGLRLRPCRYALITGCHFIGTLNPVNIEGSAATSAVIRGCADVGTQGSGQGITVADWTNVVLKGTGGNRWENGAAFPSFEKALSFPSIAAQGVQTLDITSSDWGAITGNNVSLRDQILVGPPDLSADGIDELIFTAFYTAATGSPTIRVAAHNPSGTSVDPPSRTFRVTVVPRRAE